MSSFVPYIVLWIVLAAVVVALIFYRRSIASHEDDSLHLSAVEAAAASQQVGIAQKLEQVDKWGKILTAVVIAYGLILGALLLYHGWVAGSRAGV